MYIFFSIMIIVCAVLLILIVLVQNSKGGGLASGFGQGNQVMGVKKTADFLEKATWALAIGLLVFCLLASFSIPNGTAEGQPAPPAKETPATPTAPTAPAQ